MAELSDDSMVLVKKNRKSTDNQDDESECNESMVSESEYIHEESMASVKEISTMSDGFSMMTVPENHSKISSQNISMAQPDSEYHDDASIQNE